MGQVERPGAGLKKNLGQGDGPASRWGAGPGGSWVDRDFFGFCGRDPLEDFIVIIAQIGIYESGEAWRGWGKLRGRERASRKILVRGMGRRVGGGLVLGGPGSIEIFLVFAAGIRLRIS